LFIDYFPVPVFFTKMWAAILFRIYGKHPVSSRNIEKENEEPAPKPSV